jgi:hypothetical protein
MLPFHTCWGPPPLLGSAQLAEVVWMLMHGQLLLLVVSG